MRGPLLIRSLWAVTWSFRSRRQVVRLWLLLDTDPQILAIKNFAFYVRRPRLFFRVRDHVRAIREGFDIIEA